MYREKLNKLNSAIIKSAVFCVVFNAIFWISVVGEVGGLLNFIGRLVEEPLFIAELITMFWISCFGFVITEYRTTKDPEASIAQCYRSFIRGPFAIAGTLRCKKDLESSVRATEGSNVLDNSTTLDEF